MKKQLLAALLILLLLLAGCQYSVVEDADEQQLTLGQSALAENPAAAPTVQPIGRGSRDAAGETAVADLQRRLTELNYLTGRADGQFGKKTEEALKRFQQMNGLAETGVVDAATELKLRSMRVVPMPTPEPTPLASGAKGDGVKEIQEALRNLGFMEGKADGDFGGKTDAALKLFQKYLYEREGIELYSPTPTPTPTVAPTPSPVPSPTPMPSGDPEQSEEPTAQPTPVPTPTPYAPDGIATDEVKEELLGNSFEVYREDLQRGAKDEDTLGEVYRLQRRLAALWYIDSGIDGDFGGGTETGLKYFQKRNNLVQTGIADEVTQRLLFSAQAVKSDRPEHPYLLKVSVKDQRVYAYKWVNGSYTKLARTMKCSTGLSDTPTPKGTFSNGGPAGRWYYFNKFDVWAQYAYRISGPYLFHSVLFNDRNTSTLIQGSVSKLGSRASHGCIRLKVEDAKWIYNNCRAGTTVTIY